MMKINLRTKYIIGEVLLFTALWIIITQIYFHIAIQGFADVIHETEFWKQFGHIYGIEDIILSGFIFGVIFSLINILFDRTRLRRLSIGKIIVIKSLLYFLANTISDGIVLISNIGLQPDIFTLAATAPASNIIPVGFILATAAYYIFFIVLLNFFYQLHKKIGARVLLNSVLGKYHQPRDEKLIFLFLDLKDSTHIAETLEHKKYSLFIKDCFALLTGPIYRNHAEVYQYVGDEAVLIWPGKKGLKNLHCLRLFFDFRRALEQKRDYFVKKYGHFPRFKAGVDYGEVTVTEVGEIRRDLAYHGDVLNTAARLEKLCKHVGKDLLITSYLNDELPNLNGYNREFVNEFRLEGKGNRIKVYAIEEMQTPD